MSDKSTNKYWIKEHRRSRGLKLLGLAIVLLIISFGLYSAEIAPTTQQGVLLLGVFEGVIALAMLLSFVIGIGYLIAAALVRQ